jgi:hypothetical protein
MTTHPTLLLFQFQYRPALPAPLPPPHSEFFSCYQTNCFLNPPSVPDWVDCIDG